MYKVKNNHVVALVETGDRTAKLINFGRDMPEVCCSINSIICLERLRKDWKLRIELPYESERQKKSLKEYMQDFIASMISADPDRVSQQMMATRKTLKPHNLF